MAVMIFGVGARASLLEGVRTIRHSETSGPPATQLRRARACCRRRGDFLYHQHTRVQPPSRRTSHFAAVRHSKDPTVFAVVFEDTAALLGIVNAAFGIGPGEILNDPVWDGVASIMIAVILAMAGLMLARECHGLLTGEAA
jgi:hypothetical protein